MFLSRFPVDTQTAIWNGSTWIGLTRYAQTQNTSGTIQHARLQGTESQDWWYYNNRQQILDAATSISGSKPRFQEVLDTMEKDQNDRVKKQEIYSLQSILTWSITLLPSAFAFCVSLAMVQKLIHKCLCREARPGAWQLQHASAMIEKKCDESSTRRQCFTFGRTLHRGKKSILRTDAGIKHTNQKVK